MGKLFGCGFLAGILAVLALGAQITLRQPGGASTGGSVVQVALIGVNLNASGQASINFPIGKFSVPPQVTATVQFSEGGQGHMGRVMIDLVSGTSFRITAVHGSGGPITGAVQVSYVAVQ